MSLISATPLPVSPGLLGQMAVRSGAIPEGMLRSGQNVVLTVLKEAAAGQRTEVSVAGRTLQAVLPGPVGVGQQIQVRVVRAAADGVQLRLVDLRQGPPALRVPAEQRDALIAAASRQGGRLTVEVQGRGSDATLLVAGQRFSAAALGLERLPLTGRWTAQLVAGPGGLQLLASAPGAGAATRALAGELLLSGDPRMVQSALQLAEESRESDRSYGPDGRQLAAGPAWLALPDGTPITVAAAPAEEPERGGHRARLTLHGMRLGAVDIDLHSTAAGMRVRVQADPAGLEELRTHTRQLQDRLTAFTGKPAAVRVDGFGEGPRPLPPEGFQHYG